MLLGAEPAEAYIRYVAYSAFSATLLAALNFYRNYSLTGRLEASACCMTSEAVEAETLSRLMLNVVEGF